MSDFLDKFLIPITTGTVFGFIINWLLEWIRSRRRRGKILAALHTHLEALPRINLYNQTTTNPIDTPQHLVPMLYPIIPFETAIFSENGVSVSEDTVKATTDYLLKAMELNALIQTLQKSFFLSSFEKTVGSRQLTLQFIFDQSRDDMPKIAEKLKMYIEKEQNWLIRLKRIVNSKKNK